MGIKYDDPMVLASIDAVEQKYNLPPGSLNSVVTKGERSNSDQVSSAGARTPFQIIPATRNALVKKYGVDPYSGKMRDAAEGAALLLREGLDRNNQDLSAAVAEYHGGTDPRNHGPITKAYTNRVMSGMQEGTQMAADDTSSRFDDLAAKYGAKPLGGDQEHQTFDQPSMQSDDRFGELAAQYGAKPVGSHDTAPSTPTEPQQPAQQQEPSFLDNVVTTAKNIPSSAMKFVGDTYQGLSQAVQHPIDTAKAVAGQAKELGNYLGISDNEDKPFQGQSGLARDVSNPVDTAKKIGAALRDDPVGTVAMLAPALEAAGAVAGTGRVGNALSKAGSLGNAATNNLVMRPVEEAGKIGLNALSGAVGWKYIPGQGRRYIKEVGDVSTAEERANMLTRGAESSVPDYRRTVEDIVPEMSARQREVVPSQQKAQLDQANDAALTSNVDRGVLPSEYYKGERSGRTQKYYEKGDNTVVNVPNQMLYENYKQFPNVYRDAINGEHGLNTGRRYTNREPIQPGKGAPRDLPTEETGNPFGEAPNNPIVSYDKSLADYYSKDPVGVTKMKGNEINQLIRSLETEMYGERRVGGKTAINPGTDEFKALDTHVKALKEWRDNVIPILGKTDKIFAKYSDQIDRSRVIEALKQKLLPILEGDSVNARSFADAMNNPEKIIDDVIAEGFNNKKVTGGKRFDKIVTPEDKKRLTDVLEELNRRSKANRLAGTTNEISGADAKVGGYIPVAAPVRTTGTVIKSTVNAVKNKLDGTYLKQAAKDFQNPKAYADEINKALPRYKQVESGKNALNTVGKGASQAAKTGNYLIRNLQPSDDNPVRNFRRNILLTK